MPAFDFSSVKWWRDGRPVVTDLDNPARPAPDASRVRRALDLFAEPVGEGQYLVLGLDGEEEYVELEPHFICHCGDALYREAQCKHLVAALLLHRDERAMEVARRVLAEIRATERSVAAVGRRPLDTEAGRDEGPILDESGEPVDLWP